MSLSTAVLATSIPVIILFGILALIIAGKLKEIEKSDTTAFFLTARNTMGLLTTFWSFYAASIGSWILFAPASFITDAGFGAGWIGLITYSVYNGLTVVVIAFLATIIRKKYPEVLSIGHYCRFRFGRATELWVTLLVLLNLSIALAAEYTGLGQLFSSILNLSSLIPILIVGLVTLTYTTLGGLYVSIITDQYQAITSLILVGILIIYVACTFRPGPLPPLPSYLAANVNGYASILTLGSSLITSSFYSDAYWQRAWAAENNSILKKGSIYAGILSTLVVFFFGLCAFLAAWAGYSQVSNTAFFSILGAGTFGPDWIIVLVTLLAVTLSESYVDSLQNAISDTVTSLGISFGLSIPLNWTRFIVLLVNIPIFVVGLQGYNIASLFLISNLMTVCSTVPLMLGLYTPFDAIITDFSVIFSNLFAFFSVLVYGYLQTGSVLTGLNTYFYQFYDWGAFLTALMASFIGLMIGIGMESIYKKFK